MKKVSHVCAAVLLFASFCLWVKFSSATKSCYNCREEQCREKSGGRMEICVNSIDVCVVWRYRKGSHSQGIKPGDVYRKGCDTVVVANKACHPDGEYDRCVCATSDCSDVPLSTGSLATDYEKKTTPTNDTANTTPESDIFKPVHWVLSHGGRSRNTKKPFQKSEDKSTRRSAVTKHPHMRDKHKSIDLSAGKISNNDNSEEGTAYASHLSHAFTRRKHGRRHHGRKGHRKNKSLDEMVNEMMRMYGITTSTYDKDDEDD